MGPRAWRATLTLTILYASKAARDQALETNFAAGMEAAYKALDDLLASPARAS